MKKNKHYDEYQLLKRYKIGYQTMFIFAFIIMINGFVKEFFTVIWSTPFLEAIVLIYIPFLYFIVMALFKNAYLRKSEDVNLIVIVFGIAFILNIVALVSSVWSNTFTVYENGKLTNGLGQLLLNLFLGILFIGSFIKKQHDKKAEK